MGKGKRIQDFRNLNLESYNETKNEYKKKNHAETTLNEKEFIIEVEEKPRKRKNNANSTKSVNKNYSKKVEKNNKRKKTQKERVNKSPITYVEEENNKKKKEKRKSTSRLVSAFLLTFIFVGVIAGCLTTPTFDVMSVEVENGENVNAEEIQKYFSDSKGKNIFLVNTSEIEKKIETHPYIYKAEVTKNLPDILCVKYKEREPYAIIKYIESYVLIDKYGSILEIKKENDMTELPIIYGIEAGEFVPGEKLEGIANLKFENSVYLLETALHTNFNYTISEINYTDSEEVKLSIKEIDVQIIYGSIERDILNDKITYLNEILKKLGDKKGTLDISSNHYSEKVIFSEILK